MAAMACMEEGQRPITRTRRSGNIPLENGKRYSDSLEP